MTAVKGAPTWAHGGPRPGVVQRVPWLQPSSQGQLAVREQPVSSQGHLVVLVPHAGLTEWGTIDSSESACGRAQPLDGRHPELSEPLGLLDLQIATLGRNLGVSSEALGFQLRQAPLCRWGQRPGTSLAGSWSRFHSWDQNWGSGLGSSLGCCPQPPSTWLQDGVLRLDLQKFRIAKVIKAD